MSWGLGRAAGTARRCAVSVAVTTRGSALVAVWARGCDSPTTTPTVSAATAVVVTLIPITLRRKGG
jgi:hypothetical protein